MEKTIEELTAELVKERARNAHLKNLLDRSNSEAAHYKRTLRDYLENEEKSEKKEKAREMEIYNLHQELEAIRLSKEFEDMGMNKEKAIDTARAMLQKDDAFYDNIASHIKEVKKAEQDKAIQKFLAENHTEINAGVGEATEYSSAENIALKHVRNINVNENDLENFK